MADMDEDGEESPKGNDAAKKKKMMMIIVAVVVLLLGGIGGGLYLFVFSGSESAQAESGAHKTDAADHGKNAAGEHGGQGGAAAGGVAYFDLPEFLVNIQGVDGSAAYLKLSVSLEVASDADKAGLEGLQPRIVDQLQAYLRELRTDDLKGSAGVMRVKEEMLRRVRAVAAPYKVRDVLLKEMVVQ